jgi:phage terminase large subunit-like protein
MHKKADYTAIVVVGVTPDGYIYVLDIDRFRSDKISGIFDHVVSAHEKWSFRKLRAEVNAAQGMIARDLKDRIRQEGMQLAIDEHKPTRHTGNKEERITAVLEPRYDNQTIYHYRGGYTPVLEEELVLARPAHDDIKDALASVIEIAKAPRARRTIQKQGNVVYHSRFGGVSFR